jgi:hypothetical protein
MSETPDRSDSTGGEPLDAKSDGPLRTYSEQLGVDFDAVVRRAKEWVAANPLPPDLGPEPFNVGKPRPPVD